MYAVVSIAGMQYKVRQNQTIYAPFMDGNEGDAVVFDQVLLTETEGNVQIGTPTVAGIKVSGKIVSQVKGDKVIVFKKKRRKGYKVKNGHRQRFTKLLIDSIG